MCLTKNPERCKKKKNGKLKNNRNNFKNIFIFLEIISIFFSVFVFFPQKILFVKEFIHKRISFKNLTEIK